MGIESEFVAEVLFIGSGNAFSPPGRMHAAALFDRNILVDAPPTILPQLRNSGVFPSHIKHLLFTHWHADHTFGFPFLMLNRSKMASIENGEEFLNVHCRPGGKERMELLCKTGFPGSLETEIEDKVIWNQDEKGELEGTDWSFERFPVKHTPETDPHGYRMIHSSGLTILHCGDSGPCEEIEKRASGSDIVILEMGVPDFVNSPFHHNPSDIESFVNRHPDATVLVTHNFSRSPSSKGGFEIPKLPEKVVQLKDGDSLKISDEGSFVVKN